MVEPEQEAIDQAAAGGQEEEEEAAAEHDLPLPKIEEWCQGCISATVNLALSLRWTQPVEPCSPFIYCFEVGLCRTMDRSIYWSKSLRN